jgi:hypothetical protein
MIRAASSALAIFALALFFRLGAATDVAGETAL